MNQMRIRRQILLFLHEKVFGHDKGDEPNNFTYFIYKTLFPFKKMSNKTISDFVRENLLLEMKGTEEKISFEDKEQFVGHNFAHFNLRNKEELEKN